MPEQRCVTIRSIRSPKDAIDRLDARLRAAIERHRDEEK
jgi:hypothetical protein